MLLRLGTGAFLVLHGFVHLWYVVLSQRWVEIEDQMGWTGYSWLLSSVLTQGTILLLGSLAYVLVALGFAVGGVGYILRLDWWEPVVIGSAVLSTVLIITLWDGQFELLVEKGAVGVFLNVAILVYLFVIR